MARTYQVIGPNATEDTNVAVNEITRDAQLVVQQETIIAHPTNDNTLLPNVDGSINIGNFPGTQNVAGTVELGASSLAALENINVTVSNTSTEITNDSGNPIPVSGTVTANTGLSQPLTDAQLRATAVPVSVSSIPSHNVTNAGTFAVQVTSAPTTTVTGTVELGSTSLSALENINVTVSNSATEITNDVGNPIPVSGTVTANTGLLQPLTDAQLRAVELSIINAQSTPLFINGRVSNGTGIQGNPVHVAGSDGTNVRTLSTDTTGKLNVNISSVVEAEIKNDTGNPISVTPTTTQYPIFGLTDGTSQRQIQITNGGAQYVMGATTIGGAAPNSAMIVAGSDGSLARAIKTDTSGNQVIVGAADSGAAVSGSPVRIAGSDGTTIRDIKTDASGNVQVAITGTPTVSTGGLTDVQLRASAVPVSVASSTLPTGASTEATLAALKSTADAIQTAAAAIQAAVEALNTKTTQVDTTGKATEATVQAINNMNESMLYMLSGMLDKMPRLTREDKLQVVLVSDGVSNNEPSSAYYPINTGAVGDSSSGRLFYRMLEPWNFSDAGIARIYQQIQVS
jgi:hypothetical protein